MVYVVYYTCPHCKNPTCGDDPMKEANELIAAPTKGKAREKFNAIKTCRHMKISKIEARPMY